MKGNEKNIHKIPKSPPRKITKGSKRQPVGRGFPDFVLIKKKEFPSASGLIPSDISTVVPFTRSSKVSSWTIKTVTINFGENELEQ